MKCAALHLGGYKFEPSAGFRDYLKITPLTCNNKETYVVAEWDDLNCTCNVDVITFPSSKILNILLQQSNLFQEKILWF